MTSLPINVLWLGRTVPFPVDAGDRSYSVGLAKALAPHVATLRFMAIGDEQSLELARRSEPGIDWIGVSVPLRSQVSSILSSRPFLSARHSPPAFVEAVKAELRRVDYDVVVLDYYGLGWALDELRGGFDRRKTKLVYIGHNYETAVADDTAREFRGNPVKRALLYWNAAKIARMETALARGVDLSTEICDDDRISLSRLGARREPVVLRPGMDVSKFRSGRITETTPAKVVIVGSFLWIPKQLNLAEFFEQAAPVMAHANIKVDVIGAVPEALKQDIVAKCSWVRFRGFVDDLDAALPEYRFGLNIERTGGGFKLKTLSYVEAGLPIAAIEAGLTGVPDELKRHMLVRQNPAELMRAVIEEIGDTASLNALADRAHACAARLYNWDHCGERFAVALNAILADAPDAASLAA